MTEEEITTMNLLKELDLKGEISEQELIELNQLLIKYNKSNL